MTWIYSQSSGRFTRHHVDGPLVAIGYAGNGGAKNDPLFQHVANSGPIPRGRWTIGGPPFQHPHAGPYTLRLTPVAGTATFGRSGFLIHGESRARPGSASRGCIILARRHREQIWHSGDRNLEVVE